jgi:hypothetical protein
MGTTATCDRIAVDERRRLRGRVRDEFLELPGMVMTRAQAVRLFGLEPDTCDAVLTDLVDAGFLFHDGDHYGCVH